MTPTPEKIEGYLRYDSRGNSTVQVEVEIDGGRVRSLVPSGASKGSREALEIPPEQAVESIKEISAAITNLDVCDQERIDQTMIDLDGTEKKSRLGANAILGVSMAVARAAAEYKQVPLFMHLAELYREKNPNLLPTPMLNMVNGGAHANTSVKFQEFMTIPIGAKSFTEAIGWASRVYGALRSGSSMRRAGLGDEGGFAADFGGDAEEQANTIFKLLQTAVEGSELSVEDFGWALDAAATEFVSPGGLYQVGEYRGTVSLEEFVEIYVRLRADWNILSIEDPVSEQDYEGWRQITVALGENTQIVGDDIFVTNPKEFQYGIERGRANAILVKPNQIGTVTETFRVIRMAKEAGYNVIISHRSGETEDTFIADLAVATRAGQIKTGAPARGERTAKYNRLLDIEQIELPRLGFSPEFSGSVPFKK